MEKKPPTSPPFLNNAWPTLLLILMALGIPGATAAAFLTQHIWLCAIIGLAYEIGLVIFGFVGKVWQRLEDSLAERVANRIDSWLQSIFSGYKKKYYGYMRDQHRDFDVKGLSIRGTFALELDQVFVDLSIYTSKPPNFVVNPIQDIPQAPREDSHPIWYFLTVDALREKHFAIIGPPGSGKTTLLKHIALIMVSEHESYQHRIHIPHKLPVLLFLRDHASAIANAARRDIRFTLPDALQEHLKKWNKPLPPQGWLQRQLDKGRCLIMLDGLDEVADPGVRRIVVRWVEQQMVTYRQNRFIVTSRPFGFHSDPVNNVTLLEVRQFTADQVEQFVNKWYLANEIMSKQKNDSGVQMVAKAGARELLHQLRSKPGLSQLTVNPLLLTMMTTIHYNSGDLPRNRVTLYEEICKVFLGRRQLARGQKLELRPEQMQLVLQPLAYHMMSNNIRDIKLDKAGEVIREPLQRVSSRMSTETFLKLVENVSGLLLERENGEYNFAHLTFQEYLAAVHVREQQLGHLLTLQVKDSWWQETIRLYCAMADATAIIEACLADNHPSADILKLAIDCHDEKREVQPAVSTHLDKLLQESIENSDPDIQHIAAGALLAHRLRNMNHLKDEIYFDTSLIICAEYQLFLDEKRAQEKFFQPDHWTSHHFPRGQGNTAILGMRSSDADAFCKWLTTREPGWHYRLPRRDELEGEGNYERLPAKTGYWLKDGQGFAWAGQTVMLPDHIMQEIIDNLAHDLFLNLSFGLSLDLSLDLSLARDLVRTFDLARNLDLDLLRIRDLAGDLVYYLDLDLVSYLAPARARARELAYYLVSIEDTRKPHFQRELKRFLSSMRTDKRESEQIQTYAAIKIYIDLTILEKRIKGELPACEGILIVKERMV